MEAGKTIIEVGLAARMKNPGFFVQKMYKNVHTRIGAHNTARFYENKKIYGSDFSFLWIFPVKYFFGQKTTFAHFRVLSLVFTFIYPVLKNLFRKVHKKVHTAGNGPSFLPGNPIKSFVKIFKLITEICMQSTVFRAMSILFYFSLIKPNFLI